MNIRYYQSSDYPVITSWFLGNDLPKFPEELIPSTGFIVENLCAGWLYKTDSKIALVETFIGNPKADKEERQKAVNLMFSSLIEEAKKQGFTLLLASSKHDRVINYGINNLNFKELSGYKVFARSL